LICVVWVGYDDNRELNLEGAKSALPIWTEFMKRAHTFRPYKRTRPFTPPDGVVSVEVDPASGKLASSGCGSPGKTEVFLAGTQPLEFCGGGGGTQVARWDLPEETPAPRRVASRRATNIPVKDDAAQPPKPAPQEPKRGFFGKIIDVFRR
jgi:penicillin-binding protein 1B